MMCAIAVVFAGFMRINNVMVEDYSQFVMVSSLSLIVGVFMLFLPYVTCEE